MMGSWKRERHVLQRKVSRHNIPIICVSAERKDKPKEEILLFLEKGNSRITAVLCR